MIGVLLLIAVVGMYIPSIVGVMMVINLVILHQYYRGRVLEEIKGMVKRIVG